MIVFLHQTLVLRPHILYPLLKPLCPSQEGALEVLKGNPLKGMETSIPLILELTWDPITNAHVITVKVDNVLFS